MILFMGVAGAGKSMQGKMLADNLALPWLSTGEFLRMLISGQRRKEMLEGKLLADNEIITLVQKMFNVVDAKNEFILDGFPRSAAQAEWLLAQAKFGQLKISAVINLHASQQAVKERLLARGRQDDTEAAIEERFAEYERAIVPILELFKRAGVTVVDVDAERDPSEIHNEIVSAIKGLVSVNQN